mgnify:CR=1 FL=1
MKHNKYFIYVITLVATLGGLLFGYDTAVISGAEKSIQEFLITSQGLSSFLHGITVSSALIGCIIGGALSGLISSRFGRKKALIIAGVLFLLSALGSANPEFLFFEKGVPSMGLLWMFNFYRVIGGIGVGLASAVVPMYIGEIAPANIRGRLVSLNQFAIIFGMLVVYFVNWGIADGQTIEWINEIGLLALAVGALGQIIGLYGAFKGIEEMGQVSQQMMAGGLRVSSITTMYGLIIYIISLVIRIVQKPRLN